MSKKANSALIGVLGLLALASATGCSTVAGPNFGMLNFPIPVSPYFQKEAEDRYWNHKRYDRMPVLGPLTPGSPEVGLDPPSDDEVMRALEKANPVQGGLPFLHEIHAITCGLWSSRLPTTLIRREYFRWLARPGFITATTSASCTIPRSRGLVGRSRIRTPTRTNKRSFTSTTTISTWSGTWIPVRAAITNSPGCWRHRPSQKGYRKPQWF